MDTKVLLPGIQLRPQADHLPAKLKKGWEFIPSADGKNENLLILYHGLGDNPVNFAKFARKLQLPSTAYFLPRAPVSLPGHPSGSAWFRSLDDDWIPLQRSQLLPSLREGVVLARDLIRNLHENTKWPFSRMHLFGFSQGGTMVLETSRLFRGNERLGGVISISGPLLDLVDIQQPSSDKGSPILLTYGSKDDIVSTREYKQTIEHLQANGCEANIYQVQGKGHSMISNQIETHEIMKFWAKTLKASAPSADAGFMFAEVQRS